MEKIKMNDLHKDHQAKATSMSMKACQLGLLHKGVT